MKILFYRCLVIAYNFIWRCGTSIDTNTNGGYYSQVNRDDCKKMVEEGIYTYTKGNERRIFLAKGGRMSDSFVSWGGITRDSCKEGPSLSVNGKSFEKHTQNTRLELTYTTGTARLDMESKVLMMPNGMRCELEQEYCELADYGEIYWKQPVPQCTSSQGDQSIIYRGEATLAVNEATKERFVTVEQEGYYFQIKLEERITGTYICGYRSFFTEQHQFS